MMFLLPLLSCLKRLMAILQSPLKQEIRPCKPQKALLQILVRQTELSADNSAFPHLCNSSRQCLRGGRSGCHPKLPSTTMPTKCSAVPRGYWGWRVRMLETLSRHTMKQLLQGYVNTFSCVAVTAKTEEGGRVNICPAQQLLQMTAFYFCRVC